MSSYETIDETGQPVLIRLDTVNVQVRQFLLGKVLTIIDASYTDRDQREAVKSLIRQAVDDQVVHMHTLFYKPEEN